MRTNTRPQAPFLLAITLVVSLFMIAPMLLSVMAGLVNNYSTGLKSGLTLRWLGEVWENYGGTVGWSLALAAACVACTVLLGVPATNKIHKADRNGAE